MHATACCSRSDSMRRALRVSESPVAVLVQCHARNSGGQQRNRRHGRRAGRHFRRPGPWPDAPASFPAVHRLVWMDVHRDANLRSEHRYARTWRRRLSPVGQLIAVMLHPSQEQDVWVHEPPDGQSSRMTFGGRNAFPIWTPDGRHLTILRTLRGPAHLFRVSSTVSQREPETLAGFSPDTRRCLQTGRRMATRSCSCRKSRTNRGTSGR